MAELPADRPRPLEQSSQVDTAAVTLGSEVTSALRELAAAEGTTIFVLLLAVFQVLVHRYSGEPDVLIGVPQAGRPAAPLLIRSRLDGVPSFSQHVRNTNKAVSGAPAHHAESGSPGGRMMFGLADVTLVLSEVEDRIEGFISFSADRFDRVTMVRLGEHLSALARTVTAQPALAPADAPLVTADELRTFARWNSTARDFPRAAAVTDRFTAQVLARPDHPAVTYHPHLPAARSRCQRAGTGTAGLWCRPRTYGWAVYRS
jgi:non-ribosomal peptide synthetase component F